MVDWRCLKSNVIPSNPSAKALLLRREKYDYAFPFTGDSLPFYNVSVYAVNCYQDQRGGNTQIRGTLPSFRIPENAQPGQKIWESDDVNVTVYCDNATGWKLMIPQKIFMHGLKCRL